MPPDGCSSQHHSVRTCGNNALPDAYTPPAAPTELLVLAHGLQGAVADFTYLIDELRASAPGSNGRLLIHASSVNTDNTHDGVVAGAKRLANDIQSVVDKYLPSLQSISLVGFSLGGMYVRYAAALLYNHQDGTVAKLKPEKIVLVASPNLGVRNFGVYRFLPQSLLSKAHMLFGETVMELVLEDGANGNSSENFANDERKVLLAMTLDDNSHGLRFVSALRAFRHRFLYANVRNDFMVNYGTAALDHTVQAVNASDVEELVSPPNKHCPVDVDYDEKGCKVCFTFEHMPRKEQRDVERRKEDEHVLLNSAAAAATTPYSHEELMAQRLRDVGWTVVAIDFPLAMPIAVSFTYSINFFVCHL